MDLERKDLGLGRRPALVVVDMSRGFTDGACALGFDCPDVVAANAVLVREFHRRGLPVFFTTVVYRNPSQARVFRARIAALNVLTPDSEWVKLDARLQAQSGDCVIEKQWASAFHRTELAQRLRALSVDSLVVTGLSTSGCVRATVVDGMQHEYRVVVVREAVGDRNRAAHEANLFDLHAKYADVVRLPDLLAHLSDVARQSSVGDPL